MVLALLSDFGVVVRLQRGTRQSFLTIQNKTDGVTMMNVALSYLLLSK